MLFKDPKVRPCADALLTRLRSCHMSTDTLQSPIFGRCCQKSITVRWNPRVRAHALQAGAKDLCTEKHRVWSKSFSALTSVKSVKNIALQQQADGTVIYRSETRVETRILSNYDIEARSWKVKTNPIRVHM